MVKAKNAIFVHSALDDAGLTPSEFRVVAHIARREGKFPCFEAVPNMAKKCNLHETTVRNCLKTLVEREILLTRKRPGRPSFYRVNHPKILHPSQSDGVHPSQSDGVHPSQSDGVHPSQSDGVHPSQSDGVHPSQSDGVHPSQSDGVHPSQSDGVHPSQSDGVHPSQSDGDKGNPINVSPLRKSARINTQDNSDSQRSHEMRSDLGRHPPPGTPWENRPPAEIPTEAEVVEFGRGPAAVPEFYCERYHEKKSIARTWTNRHGRLIDWRRELIKWFAEDGRPTTKNEASKRAYKRGFDRNAGTANEGKASEYAGVGKL